MADIGEECRFGAVKLAECLGASTLIFVGLRVSYSRSDLAGDETQEALIIVVE